MKTITELSKEIYETAKSKGWYDNGGGQNVGERIALVHSELSEALEADRNGRHTQKGELEVTQEWLNMDGDYESMFKVSFQQRIKDTFEDEIADTVIRCLDMAAHMGFDLESHILAKMKYNSMRPQMHGGKKY
jgi:NTP pyrophosphatase (non-canonical NTP hydrolase)